MALQVVSILSSSKGALEVDEKELSDYQKQSDNRGRTDRDASSSGSKLSSSKSQLPQFGKASSSSKLTDECEREGEGVAAGDVATGEAMTLNKYFRNFLVELLRMFNTDHSLLDTKGSFVIRSVKI